MVGLPADTAELVIGGLEEDGNFANRGDVVVDYAGAPGEMRVELRRFVTASTDEGAKEEFDELELWAYDGDLLPPDHELVGSDCYDSWRADCRLRVFYTGEFGIQPSRLGADIRVTLPPKFEGKLDIQTREEPTGGELSDVIIDGLFGSATVDVGHGDVSVVIAAENPGIRCAPDELSTCEEAGWALGCGCTELGSLRVWGESGAPQVTVDVPSTAWVHAQLESGTSTECEFQVDCGGFGDCSQAESAGRVTAHINDPSEGAADWGGYAVRILLDVCAEVTYAPWPACEEDSEPRGSATICSGCL